MLDVSKAEKEFGFKGKIGLEEGLKKTIEWYLSTREAIEEFGLEAIARRFQGG